MSDEKRNLLDDYEWKLTIEKGGPGSGHWGHAGRPGQRGGSVSGSIAMSIRTGRTARERQAAAAARGRGGAAKPVPAGTPVSEAFDLSGIPGTRSAYGRAVREAMGAIDSVHGDGDLPTIPIKKSSGLLTTGTYRYTYSGNPVHIKVSTKGTIQSDFLHEAGHFLDHQTLGKKGTFESTAANYGESSPAMQKWFNAAKNSRAMQSLLQINKRTGP